MPDSYQQKSLTTQEKVETLRYALDHGLAGDLTMHAYSEAMGYLLELEEQLEAVRTWFVTEPWKGRPDPSSFGGSPDYTPRERALGYGSYRDDRFLPDVLRGLSNPAKKPAETPPPA